MAYETGQAKYDIAGRETDGRSPRGRLSSVTPAPCKRFTRDIMSRLGLFRGYGAE